MKNKKLLKVLSIVLVVCMLATLFVACGDKNKDKDKNDKVDTRAKALNAILEGAQGALSNGTLADLTVSGTLDLAVNESKYKVKLNLDLDLLQESEKNETVDKANTLLEVEIQDASNNPLIGFYYYDGVDGIEDPFSDGVVYIQYKKSKTEQVKKCFDAPAVKAAMKARGASVKFEDVSLDGVITNNVGEMVDTIASFLDEKSAKVSDKNAHVEINLGDVLQSLAGTIDLNGPLAALNIDTTTEKLFNEVLPAINITIDASLNNKVLTGASLGLAVSQKNIEISRTSAANGGKLLVLNISKDITVTAGLEFKIGGNLTSFAPSDLYTDGVYEYTENLIDVEFSADIEIPENNNNQEPIKLDIAELNGSMISIDLTGISKMQLFVKLRMNPWPIVSKINNGLDFTDDNGFSLDKTLDSAKIILQAIDTATIKLIDKSKTTDRDLIAVTLITTTIGESRDQTINLAVDSFIKGLTLSINNLPLDQTITTVKNFINGSSQSTEEDAPEIDAATLGTLGLIGTYLKGAYIGINDKVADHSPIYATFDTSKTGDIPFSYYTEYKGSNRAAAAERGVEFYTYVPSHVNGETGVVVDGEVDYIQVSEVKYDWKAEKIAYWINEERKENKDDGGDCINVYFVKNGNTYEVAKLDRSFVTNQAKNGKYFLRDWDEEAKDWVYTAAKVFKNDGVTPTGLYKMSADNSKATGFLDDKMYYIATTDGKNTVYEPVVWELDTDKTYYMMQSKFTKVDADVYNAKSGDPAKYTNTVYVKGTTTDSNSAGKAFGIGLNAELKVGVSGLIAIDATIKNMDVFGLPATFQVKIGGLSGKLFPKD